MTAPFVPPMVRRRRMMLPGFEEQAPIMPEARPRLLDESRFQQAMAFGDQTDQIDQAMGLNRPQPTGLRRLILPAAEGLAAGLVENMDPEATGVSGFLRGVGQGFLGQRAVARQDEADQFDRNAEAQKMKLQLLGLAQNERRLRIMERPEPVAAPEAPKPMVVGRSLVAQDGRVLYRDPEQAAAAPRTADPKWDKIVDPAGRVRYFDPISGRTLDSGLSERIPGTGPNATGNPGKTLPFAVVQDLAGNERQLGTVNEALRLLNANPDAVGGPKNWMLPRGVTNFFDREGAKVRNPISDIGSLIIKDRSGAAVTEHEMRRLNFIPNEDDPPEVTRDKLTRLAQYIATKNQQIRDYYAAQGYGTPDTPATDAGVGGGDDVDTVAAQVWKDLGMDADPAEVEAEVRRRLQPALPRRATGTVAPDGTPTMLLRRP